MTLVAVEHALRALHMVHTSADLALVLAEASRQLGFRHYALAHHIDFGRPTAPGLRLHNYPEPWVDWFDRAGLGVTDPIHRASHTTLTCFRWLDVPTMIRVSRRDREVLAAARDHGLGDGLTVPANVPGETLGSCSFAVAAGEGVDERQRPATQLVGQFAFEAARRLAGPRVGPDGPELTDRQIECVMWVGRGKTDWEIARILGVSHATVVEHLRHARERYAAPTRAMLPVRALYDGALSFADLIAR